MGQGVRTGLGHGGITCVLQTQFSSFIFFFLKICRRKFCHLLFGSKRVIFKLTLQNNSWKTAKSGELVSECYLFWKIVISNIHLIVWQTVGRNHTLACCLANFVMSTKVNRSIDGRMICDFTSFSTVFQSYQDDVWMIMKGCVQWNSVYG